MIAIGVTNADSQNWLSHLAEGQGEEVEDAGADQGCARNGEHPGPHDAARDAPAYRGESARSAHANNRAGDGVRGAHRNAEVRGAREGERAGGLRGESAEWGELGDALPHGFDDAPAPGHGAAAHGEMATNNHPIRNVESFEQAAGRQRCGDDARTFLRVVGAVAETVDHGGAQLQPADPPVALAGPLLAYDATSRAGDGHAA